MNKNLVTVCVVLVFVLAAALVIVEGCQSDGNGKQQGSVPKQTSSEGLVGSKMLASLINSAQNVPWTADANNQRFVNSTLGEIRAMLGLRRLGQRDSKRLATVVSNSNSNSDSDSDNESLPLYFETKIKWPGCIQPVRDQGDCGACWAFAAVGAFSNRLCIASKGATKRVLSVQDMVSCDKSNFGCEGGYMLSPWNYLQKTGVVTESCSPYKAATGVCPKSKVCSKRGEPYVKYKAKQTRPGYLKDVASAMKEIYTYGPITAGYDVYEDFLYYRSGVYVHTTGQYLGGHAVKVVGWGRDGKSCMDYWIVENSWGIGWGIGGYFWIAKGRNECGFESEMVAGYA